MIGESQAFISVSIIDLEHLEPVIDLARNQTIVAADRTEGEDCVVEGKAGRPMSAQRSSEMTQTRDYTRAQNQARLLSMSQLLPTFLQKSV